MAIIDFGGVKELERSEKSIVLEVMEHIPEVLSAAAQNKIRTQTRRKGSNWRVVSEG